MVDEKLDFSKFDEDLKPIDIRYYLIKYYRYWPIYLISISIAVTLVFFFHRYSLERYEVKGSILINKEISPEVKIFDRSNIFEGPNNLENDILLFTSKNLASETLQRLHFDVSYYASTQIKEIELYQRSPIKVEVDWDFPQLESGLIELEMVSEDNFTLKKSDAGFLNFFGAKASGLLDSQILNKIYAFGEDIISENSKFKIIPTKPLKEGDRVLFVIHNPANLADIYANAITVKPLNNFASVLQITLETTVIEKGRDYVNALMDAYIDYDIKEKNRIADNTLQFIDAQLISLEDSLNEVEEKLLKYKVANKFLDITNEYNGVLNNIQGLEFQLQNIEFELSYYQSLRSYLTQKNKDYSEILAPSVIGINDAFLNKSIEQLTQLSFERRRLSNLLQSDHPNLKLLEDQVDRLRDNIYENINNLVNNTQLKKNEIQKKLRKNDEDFVSLPEVESTYSNIYREFRLRENLYNYLLEKRAEVGIAKASNVSDNTIIDYAKRGKLIFPQELKNYSYAVGMGLLVPLIFLFLYHYLNNKIMDQIQLKNILRIPLLGTIGLNEEQQVNILVKDLPKSNVSESFRSMRSALFFVGSEKKCKKILITSSVSGEGKTFVSANLAAAMALSGKKTCLVGLDLRKPKISEKFTLHSKKGLTSYLINKANINEIIFDSEVENLSFVPSGPVPPNPSELLLKDSMKDFFKYLEDNFDIIILDTPPIGLVSETMDLLRFSDVNLFIVRQNYTESKHLLMINDLYANQQINNVYCIFNGVSADSNHYNFGGYSYGYGYNSSYYQKSNYYSGYYSNENEVNKTNSIQKILRFGKKS